MTYDEEMLQQQAKDFYYDKCSGYHDEIVASIAEKLLEVYRQGVLDGMDRAIAKMQEGNE